MPTGVSVREGLIAVAKLDVSLDVGDAHELAEKGAAYASVGDAQARQRRRGADHEEENHEEDGAD